MTAAAACVVCAASLTACTAAARLALHGAGELPVITRRMETRFNLSRVGSVAFFCKFDANNKGSLTESRPCLLPCMGTPATLLKYPSNYEAVSHRIEATRDTKACHSCCSIARCAWVGARLQGAGALEHGRFVPVRMAVGRRADSCAHSDSCI